MDNLAEGFTEADRVIWQMPTVDAEAVVRCRDCKYYRVGALLAPNKFCFRLKHPEEDRPIGYNFAPDDFCSHGERMDGGACNQECKYNTPDRGCIAKTIGARCDLENAAGKRGDGEAG